MATILKTPAISNVDMLSVLEVQIPKIRTTHQSLTPFVIEVTEWKTRDLNAFDTALSERTQNSRLTVDNALRCFANASLRSRGLESVEITNGEIDLYLCQMVVKELSLIAGMFDAAIKNYQMPYTVLCQRLIAHTGTCGSVDSLHVQYGELNKHLSGLLQWVQTSQEFAGRLLDYRPCIMELVKSVIHAGASCTSAYSAIIRLNQVHHQHLDYINQPFD